MTTTKAPVTLDAGGVSRREFFVGAGATAGAFAAIGSMAGLTHSSAAEAAIANRKYYSYSVALELDGQYAGAVFNAEGGEPVLTLPASRVTGDRPTVRYEPLKMRLADMSKAFYDWIGKSAAGTGTTRLVSVIAANQDLSVSYRLDLQNARLTEITLDPLDGSSQEVLRFNVTIAPGSSTHQFGSKTAVKPLTVKASPLMRSNYLLYIQGFDAMAARVRHVDPVGFSVDESGTLVPLPLKFEVGLQDAAPLYQWMNDALAGKASARPGELQLLTRDRTKVASSVSFEQLAVTRVGYPTQSGNGEAIQTVEVECTPASARFNLGELLT